MATGAAAAAAREVEVLSAVKTWEGTLFRCSHPSKALGDLTANFSVFLPLLSANDDGAATKEEGSGRCLPHIFWLSGLTCTDENFVIKAGAFQKAREHGIGLVIPDTSPRGGNVPGEDDVWTLGTGASFYVDATEEPWAKHYRMFSYITDELPQVVESAFPSLAGGARGVSGHSMGGHGALVVGLRKPGLFKSISAFAAISNPTQCDWGRAAFRAYLGSDEGKWREYDATELIKAGKGATGVPILLDQGDKDGIIANILLPDNLNKAMREKGVVGEYKLRRGYDHSYYYVSTFIGEHIAFHAKHLKPAE